MTNETNDGRGSERELRERSANQDATVPSLASRATTNSAAETKNSSATLWIGVGAVFLLMALAWTAMFFFSSKYRPASVPLETREEAR